MLRWNCPKAVKKFGRIYYNVRVGVGNGMRTMNGKGKIDIRNCKTVLCVLENAAFFNLALRND